MAESNCLHIQEKDAGPIRVVEIPWISVRIGRATHCEVRLADPGIVPEACRLQRRGRCWYLIPSAPRGLVSVQEVAVEEPRPLPFDVPFRVGSCSLTLRQSTSADPDWGMYRAAAPVQAPAPPEARAPLDARAPARPVETARPRTAAAPKPPIETAAPNPWEARWKAAGARLSAAAERPSPIPQARPTPSTDRAPRTPLKDPAALLPRSAEASVALAPSWDSPTRPAPRSAPPGYPTPPAVSSSAPRPAPFTPATPTPPVQAAAPPRPQPLPRTAPHHEEPAAPAIDRAAVVVDHDSDQDHDHDSHHDIDSPPAGETPPAEVSLPIHSEPAAAPVQLAEPVAVEASAPVSGTVLEADARPQGWDAERAGPFVADTSWFVADAVFPVAPFHAGATASGSVSPDQAEAPAGHTPRPEVRSASLLDPGPAAASGSRGRSRADGPRRIDGPHLPSVKDILSSAPARPSPRPSPPPPPPPRQAAAGRVTLTVPQEPAAWAAPLWLAWLPAALLTLGLGAGGFFLAIQWAREAYNASVVAQGLLAQPALRGREKPLPEGVVPPELSWWRTTPLHLTQWAAYLGRPSAEDDRAEEARALLDAAVQSVPAHPAARLARVRSAPAPAPGAAPPVHALGLSRDAIGLAWSARTLRQAGKKEAAVRVYREALQIACGHDRLEESEAVFNDDPELRRYFLPGESTALAIVRELAEGADWTYQDWSGAVPKQSVASLAAARLLRDQDRPEGQALLKALAAGAEDEPPTSADHAIRRAVRAEAMVLLAQWKEAAREYLRAIEQVEDGTTRRSWWFNLARVASSADDPAQCKLALDAALDVATTDDICRQAIKLRQGAEPPGRLRSHGTKAN